MDEPKTIPCPPPFHMKTIWSTRFSAREIVEEFEKDSLALNTLYALNHPHSLFYLD